MISVPSPGSDVTLDPKNSSSYKPAVPHLIRARVTGWAGMGGNNGRSHEFVRLISPFNMAEKWNEMDGVAVRRP
jgi:hypothetical protein